MEEEEIVMFFETSSKTAINVAKAFEELGKQLFLNQLSKRGETMTSFKKNVRLSQPKEKSDSVCCWFIFIVIRLIEVLDLFLMQTNPIFHRKGSKLTIFKQIDKCVKLF